MKEAIELLIAGTDLENCLPPVLEPLADFRLFAVRDAIVRCLETDLAVAQLVKQAAVPDRSGRKVDLKADAAIGIYWSRIVPPCRDVHLAAEILVAVDG